MRSETLLDIHLSAFCSRHQFTTDPAPVVEELRRMAGARTDILHATVGHWIGYYETSYTAPLVGALRAAFPESVAWEAAGRERRGRGVHGTSGFERHQ